MSPLGSQHSHHGRPATAERLTLEVELLHAVRVAADERLVYILNALDLPEHRVPIGFAHVVISSDRYRLDLNGDAAAVIAVEENSQLVDLCCCRLSDRHMALRIGAGRLLGMVWYQRAVVHGETLVVHRDALAWLHRGAFGVVLVDWCAALPLLYNVRRIRCDCEALAARLQGALAVMGTFPEIEFARPADV
jgi:hypothetical protein